MRSGDNKSLLERMDRLVLWSGIPQLNSYRVRRRRLRWTPIMTLAIATVGLIIMLLRPSSHGIGYLILMVGFAIGNFLPMFGPVKPPFHANDEVDEGQRNLRCKAFLIGFGTISAAAFLGLWVLIALTELQNWSQHMLLRAMMALTFYFLVLFSTVPTLYASWATPVPVADEERDAGRALGH